MFGVEGTDSLHFAVYAKQLGAGLDEQLEKFISYSELLTLPEWIEKRNIILDRDNHKCQYCGKTHDLQVHHKYYSKYPNNKLVDPWNYPNDALITLCSKCHKWIHSQKKNKVYYRKYD